MACEPKFVGGFDFACVTELIADVRAGSVSVGTIQKGLWVVGNALSFFSPDKPVGPFASVASEEVAWMSVSELCDALEAKQPAGAMDAAAIDPATILMIVQLVWKLIQALKK
jgi:hypothetical protein